MKQSNGNDSGKGNDNDCCLLLVVQQVIHPAASVRLVLLACSCRGVCSGVCQGARRKEGKLGRVFAGEGDVMEEHERDKVEQNALQVS